jgi:hypothetical protein
MRVHNAGLPARPQCKDARNGTKKAEAGTLHIDALRQGRVTLRMIGSTPFYFNAMSAKAKRSLLVGGGFGAPARA